MRSRAVHPSAAPALRRDQRGFPLVELLVVLLAVGVLAAIALPTFAGQSRRGRDASAKTNARNLVGEVEACTTEKNDYPPCHPRAKLQGVAPPAGPAARAAPRPARAGPPTGASVGDT